MSGITLSTFGDLIRHGFNLAGHCRACSRHEDFNLAKMPADRRYVGARFRCRSCGGKVSVTVSQVQVSTGEHLNALEKWRRG